MLLPSFSWYLWDLVRYGGFIIGDQFKPLLGVLSASLGRACFVRCIGILAAVVIPICEVLCYGHESMQHVANLNA